MKKIIISLLILLCLTGCWNYKELNEYAIISGIAIDKKDDLYEVSILISNSPKNDTSGDSGNAKVVVYSGYGDTIVKAMKDIGLISSKEMYLGSFSVLVVSDDVAKDGLSNAIDFFLRYASTGKNFFVVVARDSKAKDTLKIMTPLNSFPSQSISENLDSATQLQGIVAKTSFEDLISSILKDGIDPVINSLIIAGDVEEGSNKENLDVSEPKSYIKLQGMCIFRDDKLVDYATYDESLGINMINNKIQEMYLKLEVDSDYVVIDTVAFGSSISVSLKNNKPKYKITLSGEARIIEVNGKIDLENTKVLSNLEDIANKKIEKYSKEALDVAFSNRSDIFGLGDKLYQKYPKYFEKVREYWNNNLGNLEVKVDSKLIIKDKVSTKNSLEVIKDEQKNK